MFLFFSAGFSKISKYAYMFLLLLARFFNIPQCSKKFLLFFTGFSDFPSAFKYTIITLPAKKNCPRQQKGPTFQRHKYTCSKFFQMFFQYNSLPTYLFYLFKKKKFFFIDMLYMMCRTNFLSFLKYTGFLQPFLRKSL
jgi:hypothetical protein